MIASIPHVEKTMTRRLALYTALLISTTLVGQAQTPAPPPPGAQAGTPAGGRAAGAGGGRGNVISPVVNPDRTITVRFNAPNPKYIELIGEVEGTPAAREE